MATDDDVIYHGYLISEERFEEEEDPLQGRIAVEVPRRLGSPKVLRKLERPLDEDGEVTYGFTWGYEGSGPEVSGAAVLSDALGITVEALGGLALGGITAEAVAGKAPEGLAHDSCADVMSNLPPQEQEWRMERRTVLWWVRGWYVGRRMSPPAAVLELPPTLGSLTEPEQHT